MDKEEIQKLLDKYYQGETSKEEQDILSLEIQRMNNKEFLPEYAQFLLFQHSAQYELDDDFDKRMEELILLNEKKAGKVIPIFIKEWHKIAAVLLFLLIISTFFFYRNSSTGVVVATLPNENKQVLLPDGSKVFLNSTSRISFPKEFDKNKREVLLEGEAFFEVFKNPDHPFFIKAGTTVTEVLGTSFNVRAYLEEEKIEVVVNTGKVSFSSDNGKLQEIVFLLPGNAAAFDKKANSIRKAEEGDLNLMAWKTRILTFKDQPLTQVLATLEKYFKLDIKLENRELINKTFTGKFNNPKITEVLEVISYTMDIHYSKKQNTYILSSKSDNLIK